MTPPPASPPVTPPGLHGPLHRRTVAPAAGDVATRHAVALLGLLGASVRDDHGGDGDHGDLTPAVTDIPAAVDWARSGGMALTGRADGPPLPALGAPASAVRGALAALSAVMDLDSPTGEASARVDAVPLAVPLPDHRLLGERAAIAGLARRGPWSPGGAFRLLRCDDGWVGCNLARPSDLELLPALSHGALPATDDPDWSRLGRWVAGQPRDPLVARGRLLGLPLVAVPAQDRFVDDEQHRARWGSGPARPFQLRAGGPRPARARSRPVVVDLSSLWAGPLAAHLLGLAGAEVVKVESRTRPDGARRGPRAFLDLLHAGHRAVALDLPTPDAVGTLTALCRDADLVIDASRPRAMAQLGLDVEAIVAAGTSWVSITGYGRSGPWADQPAFGDDAAAAAGLVAWEDGVPLPAGDAIADPLTGVHAAVASAAALTSPTAWLIDVALRDVAAVAAALPGGSVPPDLEVHPPRARPPRGRAAELGADTDAVLAALAAGP